jgi:hypothetical protein
VCFHAGSFVGKCGISASFPFTGAAFGGDGKACAKTGKERSAKAAPAAFAAPTKNDLRLCGELITCVIKSLFLCMYCSVPHPFAFFLAKG